MARDLVFRLSQPGYTIYHRAALGGLAATVRAWGSTPPDGIVSTLESDHVRLQWSDGISDQEALGRILDASFRLTTEKLIELVGHAIPAGSIDLRLAIHNGLYATFLQHSKMRPSEKEPRRIEIRDADGNSDFLSYRALQSYAHQSAQGTRLLAAGRQRTRTGPFPRVATIPQSVVPGAMKGRKDLEATAEEALLLLFLMVGCSVFLLRPHARTQKTQVCVVVPDVIDLVSFARATQSLAKLASPGFSNTYLGRVVGGAEDAALRLLIDLTSEQITDHPSVAGAQVIAMGKVAWGDKKQTYRSGSVRVGGVYPELAVFKTARTHLGGAKILRGPQGDGFAIPASSVPELVAANLVNRRHWAAHFCRLVATKKDFANMRFAQKGLKQMQEAIQDSDDIATIELFQSAWRQTMGALGERARRDGLDFGRLVEVERERIRNAILRSKTSDALAGWLLRFCADATKGAPLETAQRQHSRLRPFLFDRRNSDRIQNLLLFALVSYAGEAKTQTIGQE